MRSISAFVLGLLLTACATDDVPTERERATSLWQEHAGASEERIVFPRLEAWKQLGGPWLAVRTQPNDFYLLRLDPACADQLRFGSGVALSIRPQTRNMLSRFDTVLIEDMRCRIQEIRPVDRDALAAELESAGLEHAFLGTP
ncbi:MAG: DUF6491 family protein [Candidatus Wenzhouxiangella sp. M2_3B_020]